MLPSARSVAFFAVLLLGLLVSGVLTPVALDRSAESESWGTAPAAAASASPLLSPPTPWLSLPAPPTSEIFQEKKWTDRPLSGDLVPVEESPPFVPDPKSALLLSSAESKEGRFFLALPNGTIYFMNKSTKPQWELLIGVLLSYSWRCPSNDDPDYIVFSDSNGELYEYSKDAGIRKHDWTVEEYMSRGHLWLKDQLSPLGHGLSTQSIYGHSWLFILSVPIFAFCCFGLRKLFKNDKKYNDLKEKQSVVPKKRKSRKSGKLKNATISVSHDRHTLSMKQNVETNGHNQIQVNGSYSFIPDGDSDGRWVGRLFVTNIEIGHGSNGTVVFEGFFGGRPVAVKRLLRAHHDVAFKEIQHLIASDRHPNIVRWYGVEQDLDFVYISLERCICSLSDLICICSDSSSHSVSVENQTSNSVVEDKVQLSLVKGIRKDVNLWRSNGLPSSQLLKIMRDVVSGLAHLHELGIIHRDLKPQNVLISNDGHLNAKLSDMGISKRLLEDMSSLSRNATGYGTSGWQAPEQLLHGRQTRAMDLFSLGCILFFCITKGKHPFGNHFERDANIIHNRMDLFLVDHIPEAEHLLCQLLQPDSKMRLNAVEVLCHPLFWSSETRLSFLRDVSDRVELEDRENESELLKSLENSAPNAFGGKWDDKLDVAFITDMGCYRKYRFDSIRDLLRVIRNKLNHYWVLPKELQKEHFSLRLQLYEKELELDILVGKLLDLFLKDLICTLQVDSQSS
ncbi:serine/threonine-protein kinase/endoribonuclease IRE1a-like isoform X2 [Musa acuminata AAA Group]|uniref:serine/threonine-protein kinase/endoribonuclease IRE1a-like isoform X2 n=1 Tax=Musa acuminata AAA Group TaxID=214697 RepID=UPI0031D81266